MAHARAVQPLNVSTGLRPPSVISPPVRLASAQLGNGCVAAVESHRSAQRCLESSHERDRTNERSDAASNLASIAPTSGPSGRLCNTCVCGTSSATLLLPTQSSVCCIDPLNPPPQAAAREGRLYGAARIHDFTGVPIRFYLVLSSMKTRTRHLGVRTAALRTDTLDFRDPALCLVFA